MTIQSRNELPQLMMYLDLPMIAAEIGVAEGLHAELMMQNGIQELYLVDRWEQANTNGDSLRGTSWHNNNFKRVTDAMTPYGNAVHILKGDSADMCKLIPDNSLSMVYIDADHSYEGALADLQRWYPKVIDGGIISGHDYLNTFYGVNKAVNEFTQNRFNVITIPENEPNNSSFYFIKY